MFIVLILVIIWWVYVYNKNVSNYVVIQSLSHVRIFATLWTAAHQASFVLHYLPEFV